MKIVYLYDLIYPFTKGGAELRFWELSKRLAAKGHEVHIIGMKFWQGEPVFKKEGVYFHGICAPKRLYTKKNGRRSITQVIYFTWKLMFYLPKKSYDIIDMNAFPYLQLLPVRIISSLKRIPLVVTWQEVWGQYWFKYLGYIKGFFGYLIEKVTIKFSPCIIYHASCVEKALLGYGAKKKNIYFVPDGADINFINNIHAHQETSDVIFLGRLIKHKNVDLLINAIRLLKEKQPYLKCMIIGDGPEKKKLTENVDKMGLVGNVSFKGIVEGHKEVIAYLKASKIFVFPSSREGFGIAAVEAMACGLPVITVKEVLNAATELIEEQRNGFVCLSAAESIAEKIEFLLTNDKLRKQMGESARLFAQAYDWDIIVEQNEKIYDQAINLRDQK